MRTHCMLLVMDTKRHVAVLVLGTMYKLYINILSSNMNITNYIHMYYRYFLYIQRHW